MQEILLSTVSLSLLVLKTRQIQRMRAFYAALGISLTEEQHGKGPVHYAGRTGNTVLEIYPLTVEAPPTDTTTRLGFEVENLAETMEAIQSLGFVVTDQPKATEWGLRALARDPDGRAVEMYQRTTTVLRPN
jgi:predicted enzyme related to lactoylglutathione lyase